jgi:hypothetical protein
MALLVVINNTNEWKHITRGLNDTPPNSLKDSYVNPKVKTMEGKGVGVRSLAYNTLGVKGACWNVGMSIRMNSQARIQNEINLHNQ